VADRASLFCRDGGRAITAAVHKFSKDTDQDDGVGGSRRCVSWRGRRRNSRATTANSGEWCECETEGFRRKGYVVQQKCTTRGSQDFSKRPSLLRFLLYANIIGTHEAAGGQEPTSQRRAIRIRGVQLRQLAATHQADNTEWWQQQQYQ
jgi:hypothetical protein